MPSTERALAPRAADAPRPPPTGPPREPASCSHCGLPVAAGDLEPGAEHQFCCGGCRVVFGMLRDHALTAYYDHRDGTGAVAEPARVTDRDYEELDDPSLLREQARGEGGEASVELLLEGVHCSACIWLVEKLPELLPGVTAARLHFGERRVALRFRPEEVKLSAIARTLDRLGYPPHPHHPGAGAQLMARDERRLLLRLGVAGASAGNAMLLALALYSGALDGMQVEFSRYFRWLSALVALPALLWSAQPFYRGALGALRARAPHVDLPVSLGIVAAAVCGSVNVLRGQGEIYFDSITALVFLLLGGRYLQLRQQRRAELSAGSVRSLTPGVAHLVLGDGAVRPVAAESVEAGQVVQVLAGDAFPVDGRVERGSTSVDVAWLTGEADPVPLGPGDEVFAGATNLTAPVRVTATRSGQATRAARLLAEVERAARDKAPIALVADRLSGPFLGAVFALAALAFALWLPSGFDVALETAMALLIVTCPCALALATPLAVSAALARAARAGWLVKGGAALEALSRPATIAFDKTGTLTRGRSELVRWVGDESLQPAVKAVEQSTTHPLARALVRGLSHVETVDATDVESQTGAGVAGTVAGRRIRVGSVDHVAAALDDCLDDWALAAIAEAEREGLTPVAVARDGEVRAIAVLGDRIRDDAVETLLGLVRRGQRLVLLSGDRQPVVDHLVATLERQAGRRLFDEARGGLGPEGKRDWIERARGAGEVFMVGDGVNDSAALGAASVGIAVHGGAEASINAADAFSLREGVRPVATLLEGARRTLSVIHVNLALSLAYNAVAAGLTLAGAISPLVAAVLMPVSSLTVISHSYRRRTFGEAP